MRNCFRDRQHTEQQPDFVDISNLMPRVIGCNSAFNQERLFKKKKYFNIFLIKKYFNFEKNIIQHITKYNNYEHDERLFFHF